MTLSAQELKRLRVHLGETQREFGERLDVLAQTVYRWESGKSSPLSKAAKKIEKLYKKEFDK